MKAAIIGHGVYGSALGKIMEGNQHAVAFFDKNDGQALDDVLSKAEVVVLAIPSEFARDFLADFPERFRGLPLILATKGLLTPEGFGDFTDFAVLSGPAFAVELNERKPTTLTATSELTRTLLQTDWLKIELTDDVKGVMACGTLKNIYAIEAGFRGLKPDEPAFETYITQALLEMKELIVGLGGRAETADLACGIGDLILTCGSLTSRNYQFGARLATDPHYLPKVTTEGLTALTALPRDIHKPPLLKEIFDKIAR
jgi:glycerol-3-phosphate dehydrogenase (NAD(P)+)